MTPISKSRRVALGIALAALSTTATTSIAHAATCPDGYPSEAISLWVGYGAGGGTDAISRAIATGLEQQQGWTVVVDNKPGAGGGVMAAQLANVAPDGLTVGVASNDSVALNPNSNPEIGYTHEDFDYLATAMQVRIGLVALTDKPYSDLEEFVQFAKDNGGATVSVAGVNQELSLKLVAEHFDAPIIPVPGKGAADALQSALGGHVDATSQGSQHVQQIKAGDMKQLASMVNTRVDYAPDSKTFDEYGIPDATINAYTLLFVPDGVPEDVRTCLSEAIDEALTTDTYEELMANFANEAANIGSEAVTTMIANDAAKYARLLAK